MEAASQCRVWTGRKWWVVPQPAIQTVRHDSTTNRWESISPVPLLPGRLHILITSAGVQGNPW